MHQSTQAHVDTTATIVSRFPDGDSLRLTFYLPPPASGMGEDVLKYIVPKGYVALDGASLTVTYVKDSERQFGVMLIQHTQDKITLAGKSVGERVNVEVDMVGKYVEKSVRAALGGGETEASSLRSLVRNVVVDVLRENGLQVK